jgi:PncC family amidohydrolase
VLYATETKSDVVGVAPELLAERGPIDPDVAVAMADGARRTFGATYGVATTGVAGPAEQDGKPVGTVYVALVGPEGPAAGSARALRISGDRHRIRRATVLAGLDMVRRRIGGLPPQ